MALWTLGVAMAPTIESTTKFTVSITRPASSSIG